MKIAIIGTGNLGKAIAKGLLKNNSVQSLYLTKRNIEEIQSFNTYENVTITQDNVEAVKQSDIIIFSVQPTHLEMILHSIKDQLSSRHVLISTITGFSIGKLEQLLGIETSIIRAMPNTAISVQKSMTCLCGNANGQIQLEKAKVIFGELGTYLEIPERLMQAATVVCASGIAFWMRLIRASSQAAIQLGFDAKEAQELAMYTCEGAANLLISTGNHPEQEIDKVTTPRGCTIEGLNEMEHRGLSSSLIKGMIASYDKINKIKTDQL